MTTEGDADWLSDTPTRAPLTILVDSSSASSNAEPAHKAILDTRVALGMARNATEADFGFVL
jgi:hypothetical protein